MAKNRCTSNSVYVSGQKIDLRVNSVWALVDGRAVRVEHWSSFPSTNTVTLVLPQDAPEPALGDFSGTPTEGFRGITSSVAAHGRGGRVASRHPDVSRPVASSAQVHADVMRQADAARLSLPFDLTERAQHLSMRRERLSGRAKFSIQALASMPEPRHSTFSRVPVELLFNRGGRGTFGSLGDKASETVTIAQSLLTGDPGVIERAFHTQTLNDRVSVRAFDGPSGPIYASVEGSTRTDAATIAGFNSVYADVQRVTYPSIVDIPRARAEKLLSAGLIAGEFQTIDGREVFVASNAVLPWIFGSAQDVAEVTSMYLEAYPDGLYSLPVPIEVLQDPRELEAYLEDHSGAPAAALSEMMSINRNLSPVSPGEIKDAAGVPGAVKSLVQPHVPAEVMVDRSSSASSNLLARERTLDQKGYIPAFEQLVDGKSFVRDAHGNTITPDKAVPDGWSEEWVLDFSANAPYGSNYRVIVYDPKRVKVVFGSAPSGQILERISDAFVVAL